MLPEVFIEMREGIQEKLALAVENFDEIARYGGYVLATTGLCTVFDGDMDAGLPLLAVGAIHVAFSRPNQSNNSSS